MKVQTVNVIEMVDDYFSSIHSFSDDTAGNQQAKALFRDLISERNEMDEEISTEDIDQFIEDGKYESSDYTLLLTHSE
jgi:hypothetical protein